jgi:uncharacterized membrane protein (UPF0127 family)
MSSYRLLTNETQGTVLLRRALWCTGTWCHFKGLQFVRHLPEDEGIIFVRTSESISGTAIHMFFMFFDIGVVWLDRQGVVVDKTYAKTWRPAYAPKQKAQYYVEARPSILDKVSVGDKLAFHEVAP